MGSDKEMRTNNKNNEQGFKGVVTMKQQTFILLAGLVLSVSAVRAQGGRLSPDLARAAANKDKIDVIVQFVSPPSQADLNGVGAVKLHLPAINGAVFSLNPNALQGLANNPRIRYVCACSFAQGWIQFMLVYAEARSKPDQQHTE